MSFPATASYPASATYPVTARYPASATYVNLWTPLALSPALWTPAYKISGADGSNVATFTDYSGNGNNYTQGTISQQGTLKLAVLNGKAVLRLDAVDDGYFSSLYLANPFSIYIVQTNAQIGNYRTVQSLENNAIISPGRINIPFYNQGAIVSSLEGYAGPVVAELNVATESHAFINGNDVTTNTGNLADWGTISIGSEGFSTETSACDIFEIVIFQGTLPSSPGRNQLYNYFNENYGIVIAPTLSDTIRPTLFSTGNLAAPVPGDVLTVIPGNTFWGTSPFTYSYQWGNSVIGPISGATLVTYTVQSSDIGSLVLCDVTATNVSGNASTGSNQTGTVLI